MEDGKAQDLMDCCNKGFGCPHCFCRLCWNNGKLPQCDKSQIHEVNSLLCKHCLKNVKDICFNHLWSSLVQMREIKHEKLKDQQYHQDKLNYVMSLYNEKYKRTV